MYVSRWVAGTLMNEPSVEAVSGPADRIDGGLKTVVWAIGPERFATRREQAGGRPAPMLPPDQPTVIGATDPVGGA